MFVTVDGSLSGAGGTAAKHALVMGMMLDAGTATAETLVPVSGETEGDTLFGRGSQLAEMLRTFKANNPRARVTAIGLDLTGTAASGTVTFSGTVTKSGVFPAYVGGERVAISVTAGDAAADIATAFAAAVNANTRLPVTAAAVDEVVTLTCRWDGTTGNNIDVRTNYRSTDAAGYPTGLVATIVAMSSGAGEPDLANAIAAWAPLVYDDFVDGIGTATTLGDAESEVADRWAETVQLYGHVWGAIPGSQSTMTTFGEARNSPYSSLMGSSLSPTAPWIWAAACAGADLSMEHEGYPRLGKVIKGVLPPAESDMPTPEEKNLLLFSGISTFNVDVSGVVSFDRAITTSQTVNSVEDTTYLPRTRMGMLQANAISMRQRLAKFNSYMIADDGTAFAAHLKIATPSSIRSDLIVWYDGRVALGYGEDAAGFQESLSVVRHVTDKERVDIMSEPNLTNELVTLGATMMFRA